MDSVGEGWGAVRIKDANGPMFRSGHMTGIKVKIGDRVNPSTIIGIQDAVGMSNGYVHAHIEGRTAAIHNAWIKANSGSKSTGSDDGPATGDDGSSTPNSNSSNTGGGNNNSTEQTQETSEPMTLEQLEAKLMDAFSKFTTEFGKNITDTKLDMSGLQKAADTNPKEVEVTPPSEMVPKLEAIQQTTDAQTKAFQQAKAFNAKAERDKNMEHILIPPKVIVRNIKQQVINNRGGGSQPVVYTSPSPMLTNN